MAMGFKLLIANLWPGCRHAWRGDWRGLGLAVCFAVAVNGALLARVGAGDTAGLQATVIPWLIVTGLWCGGLLWLWRDEKTARWPSPVPDEAAEGQFREAQRLYLRGHWIEAETLLTGLVRERPQDVEGRLLLAVIARRTKRWSEARHRLLQLKEDRGAERWSLEIETELCRVEAAESEANAGAPETLEAGGAAARAA